VINGKPIKYEAGYKTFLEELNDSEIASIDILKQKCAITIYNNKSVLTITLKNSETCSSHE